MKNQITVGDSVEVDLNTGIKPFKGKVTATNPSVGSYEFCWYKIEPENRDEMPGLFWYKDTEVRKV